MVKGQMATVQRSRVILQYVLLAFLEGHLEPFRGRGEPRGTGGKKATSYVGAGQTTLLPILERIASSYRGGGGRGDKRNGNILREDDPTGYTQS